MTDQSTHPARYTPALLPVMARYLVGCHRLIDPFAGTCERLGTLAEMVGRPFVVGVEITPEFIEHPCGIAGDATALPFADCSFDAAVSSPTYGNGMNDSFRSREGSRRHTYSHAWRARIGDPRAMLPETSTARWLFDSPQYAALHLVAWHELWRVLAPGATFVLNTKNTVARRYGAKVASAPVTAWHRGALASIGFVETWRTEVAARGLRHGSAGSRDLRHAAEDVTVFVRP